jgi:mRNA-degrading endonuclease RelE of RelBE toxin-antitoxin system
LAEDAREMPRYELRYDAAFLEDERGVASAFELPMILAAVGHLADQAEVETQRRRRLARPVSWCVEATWQLKIGSYRVLYRVDGGTVSLLRLRFKGSKTTEEMGS